jgi:hypothetical protein
VDSKTIEKRKLTEVRIGIDPWRFIEKTESNLRSRVGREANAPRADWLSASEGNTADQHFHVSGRILVAHFSASA